MSHEQFEDVIPLYVIGALERSERQALEAHLLTGCRTCRIALEEYRPIAAKLPFALNRVPVTPDLKTKLMESVTAPAALRAGGLAQSTPPPTIQTTVTDEDVRPTRGRSTSWSWFAHPGWAAAALLIVAAGTWYAQSLKWQVDTQIAQRQRIELAFQENSEKLTTLQKIVTQQEETLTSLKEHIASHSGDVGTVQATLASRESEIEALRAELARRDRDTAALRATLAQRDEMLTFLRSPSVRVISLAGLEKAKSAGAFLLFDPDTKKAFFYAFNMPALPSGKTYQLWAILDKPVSAGTFTTDAGQKGRLVVRTVPELARINKFAVSVEPEGGRPQPTGDIYLMGQL